MIRAAAAGAGARQKMCSKCRNTGHNKNTCPMNTGAPAVPASASPIRFGPPARNSRIRREEPEDADERIDGSSEDEEISDDEENMSDGQNSDADDNIEAEAEAAAAGAQSPRWVEKNIPRSQYST